jgi:hypothetical protein
MALLSSSFHPCGDSVYGRSKMIITDERDDRYTYCVCPQCGYKDGWYHDTVEKNLCQ